MLFCGWCGAALDPPDAVNVHAERRVFGVPPATALLAVGAVLVGLAIWLLLSGPVIAGAILLFGGLLLLRSFPDLARRRHESGVARKTVRSYDGARGRVGAAWEAMALRVRARRRAGELDRDLAQLREARRESIVRLGEAAYARDEEAVERLRGEITTADRAIETKEAEKKKTLEEVEEKVEEVRSSAAPTERFTGEGPNVPPDEQ